MLKLLLLISAIPLSLWAKAENNEKKLNKHHHQLISSQKKIDRNNTTYKDNLNKYYELRKK